MKRKFKVAIVAAVMALTMIPAAAFATGDVCEGGNSCAHEAAIGDTHYATLAGAVALVQQDGMAEIVVLKDITESDSVVIDLGKKITVDLNGNDIGFAQGESFRVKGGELSIEGTGEIYEIAPYYSPVRVYGSETYTNENYSIVNIGPNVTSKGWAGLFIAHNDNSENYGIVANVRGTLNSVKDTDGAGGHALYVNGNIKSTNGSVKINLDGASLKTEKGNGMYLAGYAITNINNSTIDSSSEGGTGIEIRAGELTINNSVIKGGPGKTEIAPNGNGSTTENVALAVVQHTTKLPVEVTVSNSVFSAGASLFEQNAQNNDADAIAKIKINVQSGSFTGSVYSQNIEKFITSGEFSENVENKYVSDAVQAKATYTDDGNVSYLIGKPAIDNKLATATSGTVTITEAAQGVEFVAPAKGVTIANESGNEIVVVDGDKKVEVGDNSSYVTPAEQPEGDKPQGDKNADGSPDTGDESSMMLMVALMAMAAGAGATAFVRKRSN